MAVPRLFIRQLSSIESMAGGGGAAATATTTSSTATVSSSLPVCTWESHCLGDTCTSNDECDHDWICPGGVCQTVPVPRESSPLPECTWEFHCLGDPCNTNDDCDHDWICPAGACQTYTTPPQSSSSSSSAGAELNTASPSPTATPQPQSSGGLDTSVAIAIGVAVPVLVALVAGIAFFAWRSRRRRRNRRAGPSTELDGGADAAALVRPPMYQLDAGKPKSELDGSSRVLAEMLDASTVVNKLDEPAEPVELDSASPTGRQYAFPTLYGRDKAPDVREESVVSSPASQDGVHSARPVSPPLTTTISRSSTHSRNYSYPFHLRSPPPPENMRDVIQRHRTGSA